MEIRKQLIVYNKDSFGDILISIHKKASFWACNYAEIEEDKLIAFDFEPEKIPDSMMKYFDLKYMHDGNMSWSGHTDISLAVAKRYLNKVEFEENKKDPWEQCKKCKYEDYSLQEGDCDKCKHYPNLESYFEEKEDEE
jgi:hypothetical protein